MLKKGWKRFLSALLAAIMVLSMFCQEFISPVAVQAAAAKLNEIPRGTDITSLPGSSFDPVEDQLITFKFNKSGGYKMLNVNGKLPPWIKDLNTVTGARFQNMEELGGKKPGVIYYHVAKNKATGAYYNLRVDITDWKKSAYSWKDPNGRKIPPFIGIATRKIGFYMLGLDYIDCKFTYLIDDGSNENGRAMTAEEKKAFFSYVTLCDLDATQAFTINQQPGLKGVYKLKGTDNIYQSGGLIVSKDQWSGGPITDATPAGWVTAYMEGTDNLTISFHDEQKYATKYGPGDTLLRELLNGIYPSAFHYGFSMQTVFSVPKPEGMELFKKVGEKGVPWEEAYDAAEPDLAYEIQGYQEFDYLVKSTVQTAYKDQTSYVVTDTLEDCLQIDDAAHVTITDKNGKNVTGNFLVQVEGQTITCEAKEEYLSDRDSEFYAEGQYFIIRMRVHRKKVNDIRTFMQAWIAEDGYTFYVPNEARMQYVSKNVGTMDYESNQVWVTDAIGADLQVEKDAKYDGWKVGDEVEYAVEVTQTRQDGYVVNLTITDEDIPASLQLINGSWEVSGPNNGTAASMSSLGENGWIVTCPLLQYGESIVIRFRCRALAESNGKDTINNVYATAENTVDEDGEPQYTGDDAEVWVNSPELAIDKVANAYEYEVGDQVQYTVTVRNTKDYTVAENVIVSDITLPEGLQITEDSADGTGIRVAFTPESAATEIGWPVPDGTTAIEKQPKENQVQVDRAGNSWTVMADYLPSDAAMTITFDCIATKYVNGIETQNQAAVTASNFLDEQGNQRTAQDDAEIYVNTAAFEIEKQITDGNYEWQVGDHVPFDVIVRNINDENTQGLADSEDYLTYPEEEKNRIGAAGKTVARNVVISDTDIPEGFRLDTDTVSVEAIPQEELPQEELPQEELPQEELPQEELPQEELPQEELPQEELPQEELPQEELPQEELPQDDASSEEILEDTFPAEETYEETATYPEEFTEPAVYDTYPEESMEPAAYETYPEEEIPTSDMEMFPEEYEAYADAMFFDEYEEEILEESYGEEPGDMLPEDAYAPEDLMQESFDELELPEELAHTPRPAEPMTVEGIPESYENHIAGTADVTNQLDPGQYNETVSVPITWNLETVGNGWQLKITDLPAGYDVKVHFTCEALEASNGQEGVNIGTVTAENAITKSDDSEAYINTAALTIQKELINRYAAGGEEDKKDNREPYEFRVGEDILYRVTVRNIQPGSVARNLVILDESLPEGLKLNEGDEAITVEGIPTEYTNPIPGTEDPNSQLDPDHYKETERVPVHYELIREGTGWKLMVDNLPCTENDALNQWSQPVVITFHCTATEDVNGWEIINTAKASADNAAEVKDSERIWINSPVLNINKRADKEEYLVGDTVTYTADITQDQIGCVARNVVISDAIVTEGVKLQKNSIVLLDKEGTKFHIPEEQIEVKGNSFVIHTGMHLIKEHGYNHWDAENGGLIMKGDYNPIQVEKEGKLTVEYAVEITDRNLAGQTILNKVKVNSDENIPKEDEEEVLVEGAELDITKESDKAEYLVGEEGVYKLTIRELREGVTARQIVIEDAFQTEGVEILPETLSVRLNGEEIKDAKITVEQNRFKIETGKDLTIADKLEVSYHVIFREAYLDGQYVVNTAKAKGSNTKEESQDNTVVVVDENPSIDIQKRSDKSYYKVGETGHYTVTVSQTEKGATARNVIIKDQIHAEGAKIVPGTILIRNASGRVMDEAEIEYSDTRYAIYTGTDLGYQETFTVTYDVVFEQASLAGKDILNVARATCDNNKVVTKEPKPIQISDGLTVFKTSDPATGSVIKKGDVVTYQIAVTNTSKENKETVLVKDLIPEYTEYVKDSAKGAENTAAGTKELQGKTYAVFILKNLAAGSTEKISFQVKVKEDTPEDAMILNVAQVRETKASVEDITEDTWNHNGFRNTNETLHYLDTRWVQDSNTVRIDGGTLSCFLSSTFP